MKISVIIPALNIETFLPRCLDSFLAFTYDDMECICVAGRSQDRTLEVLREYARRDNRVKVVEQSDSGLSEARNLGASMATGEYILFADGDDFIVPSRMEELLTTIEGNQYIDVFVTDFSMFTEKDGIMREKTINQIGEDMDRAEGICFLPAMLKKRQCFWNVWRYVYRRGFLEEQRISFRNGSMSEDLDYTNKILLANPRIMFLHCPFYCYRVARENSLMGCTTSRRVCDTVHILAYCIEAADRSNFKWKQCLIEQYQFELILTMAQIYEIPEAERAMIVGEFENVLPLLMAGSDKMAKMANRLCATVGVLPIARCLALAKRSRRRRRTRWKISKQTLP